MDAKENAKLLINLNRDISLKRLRECTFNPNIQLNDQLNDVSEEANYWHGLILIGGEEVQILTQVSFNMLNVLGLAGKVFVDINENEYSYFARDFIKEYCNLIAGLMKATCSEHLDVDISLPLIAKSVDPLIFFGAQHFEIFKNNWELCEGEKSLYLSCYTMFTNHFDNRKLEFEIQNSQDTNEEIEFF